MSRKIRAVALPTLIIVAFAFIGMRVADTRGWKCFFDNLHWTVSETGAAAIVWIGAMHARNHLRSSRIWFAWALTVYAIGQFFWDVQVAISRNPFPAPSDMFFLFLGLGCGMGLWKTLRTQVSGTRMWAAIIDVTVLTLAGLIVTMAVYLPLAGIASTLQMVVLGLYPITLIGATSLAVIVVLAMRPRFHWSWALVLPSLAGNAVIWVVWNKNVLLHQVDDGTWYNSTFSIFALLLGFGAAYWQIEEARDRAYTRVYDLLSRVLPIIVIVAVGIANLVINLDKQINPDVESSTAILGLFVIVLAIARQSLLLSKSDRLLDAELRAAEHESRFRRLAANVKDMIFRFSIPAKQFEYVSPAAETIFGYTPAEWRGSKVLLRDRIRADHRQMFDQIWRAIRHGKETAMTEFPIMHRNGDTRWISLRSVLVRDEQGEVQAVEGIISDITSLKSSEEKFAFLAHHDSLTALPNRLLFEIRLEQVLARAQRHRRRFAVLFIDLDQFKTINDSLGHEAGDRLLVEISSRMLSRMRREDTLARWGGDEFTALIEDLPSADDVTVITQSLLESVSTPFTLTGDQTVSFTASIGVSLYPDDSHSAQELIRNADTAMYAAKSRGGNQPCFYSATMTERARERLQIRNGLRRALDRGEFFVVYQPCLNVATGRIIGAEALLRWRNQANELVPPDKFIPVAESSGLINAIGAWTLSEACRHGRIWIERDPEFSLSVNVSPRQLHQLDFAKVLRETLERWNMPASQLVLEITESTIVEIGDDALRIIDSLKAIGVKIAVDDFGTGLSSLANLKRFDVDTLKIDRSFVRDIPGDRGDMEIAATIVAMGLNLGLEVTAEGVETREQLDFLRGCGCTSYQGFLFSPGVPADELSSLMDTNRETISSGNGSELEPS
jgi:diguanylate cyclase (GGDEF)-like protein/PAS domain S-box-containing protein